MLTILMVAVISQINKGQNVSNRIIQIRAVCFTQLYFTKVVKKRKREHVFIKIKLKK